MKTYEMLTRINFDYMRWAQVADQWEMSVLVCWLDLRLKTIFYLGHLA